MKGNIEKAVEALKKNKIILLKDNLGPSIKGYLISPAYQITPEIISIIVNEARGVICAALTDSRSKELGLQPMFKDRNISEGNFTVSIEARRGVSTGISSADRANTLRTLATTNDPKLDLVTPGHIFPFHARKGGVLVFSDIAEAASDLMSIAKLPSTAAYCHCLNEKGDFQTEEELTRLEKKLNLVTISILDIIKHRLSTENFIKKIAEANLPTKSAGSFKAICFQSDLDNNEHLALLKGEIKPEDPVLVRVHAENKLEDIFSLVNKNKNNKITESLKLIDNKGSGIFLYINQSKQASLSEELRKYKSEKKSQQMDLALRENGIGSQILSQLGVKLIELISNSTNEYLGLEAFDLKIIKRIALY